MKVTKYPQSCIKIEKDGQALVIDPGSFFVQKYQWNDIESETIAVLYTHEHGDHFDGSLLSEIQQAGLPIYVNESTAKQVQGKVNIVKPGQEIKIGNFTIKVVELPHFDIGGGEPQNVGYVVDGLLLHPGDSFEANDPAANLLGPISHQANEQLPDMIKRVGAKKLIPIHYSNPAYPGDPDYFKKNLDIEVVVLADGESTEI